MALAQAPYPNGGGVRPGTFPAKWITGGPNCIEVPDWQVHAYNDDFYILRQSGCVDYEKPFLYLVIRERQSSAGRYRRAAQRRGASGEDVIAKWLKPKNRPSITLIVAHSHGHGDHVAGDAGFKGLPNITMVPLTVEGTSEFFGIEKWPEGIGHVDLGERVLDVIPIPGHHALSIAFYDRETGRAAHGRQFVSRPIVRGRIFPRSSAARSGWWSSPRGRLWRMCWGRTSNRWQCRIKIMWWGRSTSRRSTSWRLSRGTLLELEEALHGMGDKPVRMAMRDFTIWPK